MANKVLKYNDVIIENILLKKPLCTGNNLYTFPLKYLANELIIQTPIVYVPFSINNYKGTNYLDISFINSEVDKNMNDFKTTIININKLVIKLINKKFKKLNFVTSIKKSDNIFSDRLRLCIEKDILVYDDKKRLKDFSDIKQKHYVKLLISPLYIWKNNTHFGIKWHILQVKIYQRLILDTYSFIDEDDKPKQINYKNHPVYAKYFKMINCGVPKEAVKHKMRIDNLDPDVLDGKASSLQASNIQASNIQASNSKASNIQASNSKASSLLASNSGAANKLNSLFANNQNNSKINLADIIKANKKKNIPKPKIESCKMFKVSINDILNQRNKLKKIS